MPATIRDNILEMKNLSELMVDLGYSAVFLRDLNILNQVNQLFQRVKRLEEDTIRMLFRVRESEQERMVLLDMMDYIKHIAHSALDIANLAQSAESTLVTDIIRNTDARVITGTVRKGVDTKSLPHPGVRMIAFKRKGNWMFPTNPDVKLLPGDFVVAVGNIAAETRLKDLLSS